jgi:hypothetical protein
MNLIPTFTKRAAPDGRTLVLSRQFQDLSAENSVHDYITVLYGSYYEAVQASNYVAQTVAYRRA